MRTYRLDTVLIIRRSVISLIPIDPHQAAANFGFETGVAGLKQCAQGKLRILNMACAFASAYHWEN